MERRINRKAFFAITMAAGICMVSEVVSARPFDIESYSGGCQQAERILNDFQNSVENTDSLDPFALNSPIKGQPFEVRWLETRTLEVENIDQEETDPDNTTQPLWKNRNLGLQYVTVALSRSVSQTDQIDQEETDPDNTPKPSSPPAGGSLDSVEMVLFETADSNGSPRRLEGCVMWRVSSTSSIEQEETDPDNTPEATSSLESSWLRFSLPPHINAGELAEGRRGREDLFWWLLGLVEMMSASR